MSSRQLAAILFVDIMGYTALMQEDEEQALQLRDKLKRKIEQEIALHNGRMMDFKGDGAVCCFNSAIEAVRAAVAIQLEMQAEPKVPVRIGIHTGDVIVDELDVYGDGVNIASRLESFAVPGSIFISGRVHDDIKNQKDIHTVSLGRYSFKNVDEPVEIFAISNPGLNVPVKEKLEGKGKRFSPGNITKRKVFWPVALLTVTVILILVFLLYNKGPTSKISTRAKSIAVLPFRNESTNREENEFFCNGIMESVLNNLAQMEALHVISRQSVEQYRGSKKSIRSIANELGVVFILEGSVQRIGNSVKVTAQLIDAAADRHLWSQEYPGELNDIFKLQSDIAQRIATELQVNIKPNEKERIERLPTKNLTAWDEYQRAYSSYVRFAFSVDRNNVDFKQILLLCDRALALDPRMAEAYTLKAQTYWTKYSYRGMHRLNEASLTANILDTISTWCRKALSIDQHSADANVLLV
jgi:TolB-like protein/class 3 adenylate cyclase